MRPQLGHVIRCAPAVFIFAIGVSVFVVVQPGAILGISEVVDVDPAIVVGARKGWGGWGLLNGCDGRRGGRAGRRRGGRRRDGTASGARSSIGGFSVDGDVPGDGTGGDGRNRRMGRRGGSGISRRCLGGTASGVGRGNVGGCLGGNEGGLVSPHGYHGQVSRGSAAETGITVFGIGAVTGHLGDGDAHDGTDDGGDHDCETYLLGGVHLTPSEFLVLVVVFGVECYFGRVGPPFLAVSAEGGCDVGLARHVGRVGGVDGTHGSRVHRLVVVGTGRTWNECREPFGYLEESVSVTVIAIVISVRTVIQIGIAIVCLRKIHDAEGIVVYHRHLLSVLSAVVDLSCLFVYRNGGILHWLWLLFLVLLWLLLLLLL